MDFEQLNLFDIQSKPVFKSSQPRLEMDAEALLAWKSRIYEHQQRVRNNHAPKQCTLFDLAPTHIEPNAIDPFSLILQPMSFYRMPTNGSGQACLYFVIDRELPLLLYVGETVQSDRRWKGTHDTKRYLDNYQSLHRQYGIETAVNIAFWWDAPIPTRPRQQLESALIERWRSPFNKENWEMWGAPFV